MELKYDGLKNFKLEINVLKAINYVPCNQVKENQAMESVLKTNKNLKELISDFALCPNLTEEELKALYVSRN